MLRWVRRRRARSRRPCVSGRNRAHVKADDGDEDVVDGHEPQRAAGPLGEPARDQRCHAGRDDTRDLVERAQRRCTGSGCRTAPTRTTRAGRRSCRRATPSPMTNMTKISKWLPDWASIAAREREGQREQRPDAIDRLAPVAVCQRTRYRDEDDAERRSARDADERERLADVSGGHDIGQQVDREEVEGEAFDEARPHAEEQASALVRPAAHAAGRARSPCAAWTRAKAGVSITDSRIHAPTANSAVLSRKHPRQPQVMNA